MRTLAKFADRLAFHDFQEMELNAPGGERWELIDGQLHKMMTGGSLAHNEISVNLTVALSAAIRRNRPACRVYMADAKVVDERNELSVYPDIMVRCGPRDLNSLTVKDPLFIVEVLSKSTGEKDKHDKADAYFRIPSLLSYWIVSQYRLDVTILNRGENDWLRRRYLNANDRLFVPSLEFEIELGDIYAGVAEFED